MNPLLEQFLSEARDFLQDIGEKLMQLESQPGDVGLMTELFRFVHTLKGNSGLFEFPEMTRVLHAGEDLMDAVRQGRVAYSQELADRLLDAMDFVGMLCDEIEAAGAIGATHAANSVRLAQSLRQLIVSVEAATNETAAATLTAPLQPTSGGDTEPLALAQIPENVRMAAYRQGGSGVTLHWLTYTPAEECFFQGDDPFFQARGTPDLLWGGISARHSWPKLADLDAYRCALDFRLLTAARREELDEYFRYMPDQIRIHRVPPLWLALPEGDPNGGPVYEDFVVDALGLLQSGDLEGLARAARTLLELSGPQLWLSSALRWLLLVLDVEPDNGQALSGLIESLRHLQPPQWAKLGPGSAGPDSAQSSEPIAHKTRLTPEESDVVAALVAVQRNILTLPLENGWQVGRLKSVVATLTGCVRAVGDDASLAGLAAAATCAADMVDAAPLLTWVDDTFAEASPVCALENTDNRFAPAALPEKQNEAESDRAATAVPRESESEISANADAGVKFGRRSEDVGAGAKSLKVDQIKIDRLMNLIGEMVVSKNALPYLAHRAESIFGVRELAREIKAQYAVINRIAEEMQDAIMQVRMMPVSFVFQRFPRLVRDTSRKLGKDVNLLLEGEETEADKNIIESLGDPLVHIVRNCLDHGFELPEVRRAAGKPATGTLTIRASQESDRVVIEISDDGKGIDPTVIKRKAYEKGLIDETTLERISDQEAVNLVFASGFSTADAVSDLSGRGVGMDVVRTAVEKVNGSVVLESEKGKGTRLRLSLPLSMAVTSVMIIESDGQIFGMPMDSVVETVRVPRSAIRTIKKSLATVLRGRIVPLKSINGLLGLNALPKANAADELAVLVVRLGDESVGLLVDDFHETIDIILKPMAGVLAGLSTYSGSALMGDGSVLMVLNAKEIL
jgi:two-component system chemotaxis sensor kinase CheA